MDDPSRHYYHRISFVLLAGVRDDDYNQSFDLTQNADAESLDSFVQATVLKVLVGSLVTNQSLETS